ncbi:MAG: pilus assembly PilX N-terminal domain-containing protein [Gemmatimonadota bacterium]|nr:MAG: pilus assembly PilX N-terminal domain-containing protein [Gemmatimonadota bacterium]
MEYQSSDNSPMPASHAGFVMPAAIFALVLMSAIAIVTLITSSDEFSSSTALRESSEAFYAAEAGLNQVWADWPDSLVSSLSPGDSIDMGWRTIDHGASYRAMIYRYDNDDGNPELYGLVVEGRGRGPRGAQRLLSLSLTRGLGGVGYKLGNCCDAAVTMRGSAMLKDKITVDGHDGHPDGWEDAGVCAGYLYDKPGLIMDDTTRLTIESEATLDGDPPLMQQDLTDRDFEEFGDLTWEKIRALADHVIDATDGQLKPDESDIYPRHMWVDGEKLCDTSHPWNWGSNDPTDPCFDYFPIILIKGEVETHNIYGQAIIIVDWNEATGIGGEFELETGSEFNGIILGKGCVEIQKGAVFHGAVYTDGEYRNQPLCNKDDDYAMNKDGTLVRFSQCAVDRAIVNAGLDEFAVVTEGATGTRLIGSRAFSESLR